MFCRLYLDNPCIWKAIFLYRQPRTPGADALTTITLFFLVLFGHFLYVGWDETNPFTLFSLFFLYTSWLPRKENTDDGGLEEEARWVYGICFPPLTPQRITYRLGILSLCEEHPHSAVMGRSWSLLESQNRTPRESSLVPMYIADYISWKGRKRFRVCEASTMEGKDCHFVGRDGRLRFIKTNNKLLFLVKFGETILVLNEKILYQNGFTVMLLHVFYAL